MPLRGQNRPRILEGGFQDGDHIEGICRRLAIQNVKGRQGEGRERLVESKAELQVLGHPHGPTSLVRHLEPFHDPGAQQGAIDLDGSPGEPGLVTWLLMVIAQELTHRLKRITLSLNDVEQHGVADSHPRDQRLRFSVDQPLEGRLVPGDKPLRRFLALDLA